VFHKNLDSNETADIRQVNVEAYPLIPNINPSILGIAARLKKAPNPSGKLAILSAACHAFSTAGASVVHKHRSRRHSTCGSFFTTALTKAGLTEINATSWHAELKTHEEPSAATVDPGNGSSKRNTVSIRSGDCEMSCPTYETVFARVLIASEH
jgi:hypothetical protein